MEEQILMVFDTFFSPAVSRPFAAPYPLWKHLMGFSQDIKDWGIIFE